METADILPLVEDLSTNISDLEQALAPLLNTTLSTSTSKLPLLDKAKLYVLATYAIESLLFSAIRLNGVDAKAHPIFQELARVKEYFGKIEKAEGQGSRRGTTLDKDAASRFIRHGLAGNERLDRGRGEKAGAKRKLEDMQGVGKHTRFDAVARRAGGDEERIVVARANDVDDDEEDEDVGAAKRGPHGLSINEETSQPSLQAAETGKPKKKKRKSRGQVMHELEDKRADEMK